MGKRAGDLTIFDRSVIVLLDSFVPGRTQKWGSKGKGDFLKNRRHAFYVASNHGPIGADLLENIGCDDELITLVRDHHLPVALDWRMMILKEADSRT